MTNQCGNDGCTNEAAKRGATGPPRRYCSNRCRQAAYRQRRHDQHAAAAVAAATDPIADAVEHLKAVFGDLPAPAKQGDYGDLVMRLSATLDQFQKATARRHERG